ncbi:hypothetical protein GCM10027019_31370 [Melaminivora jejuensis]
MHSTSNSPVRALLGLPEINACGILHSIVFKALPPAAQHAIRATADEQQQVLLACEAGDDLPAIAQMYEDLITAPAQRRAQGVALAQIENLDNSFLSGLLRESDRQWLRVSQPIEAIEVVAHQAGWAVRVSYNDGQQRLATALQGQSYSSQAQAQDRAQQIKETAANMGLI